MHSRVRNLISSTKYVDINSTEEVLIEVAINGNNWDLLRLLFEIHRDKIEITENVLKAAMGTKHSFEILSITSKFKGKQVQNTYEIKELMSEGQLGCWDRPGKYLPSSPRPKVSYVKGVDAKLDFLLGGERVPFRRII